MFICYAYDEELDEWSTWVDDDYPVRHGRFVANDGYWLVPHTWELDE